MNKTPLSAKTNRMIGGNAPSVYLARIQKSASIDEARMDRILTTHLIHPSTMRRDDFTAFFEAREASLLERIEKAMGKAIARDLPVAAVDAPSDYQEEEEAA